MSRIILAALRKHRTPAEFVRRFLLPVYKRGKVPRLPPLAAGQGSKPVNPHTISPIIFINERNPREEFYFSVERINAQNFGTNPNVVVFNRQEKGAKVQLQDWEEGKRYANTRQRGVFEELEIDKEHLSAEWEKVAHSKTSGRRLYPIPEPLFREIQKYGTAGQAANAINVLLRLASRQITPEQAKRMSPFLIRHGINFLDQFAKSIPISNKGLRTILSAATPEEIARVLKAELDISSQFALRLGEFIADKKSRQAMRFGRDYLIGHFGKP